MGQARLEGTRNDGSGMPDPLLTDGAGRLLTSAGGTAQGSATATQSGTLDMAAVTTSPPAYTDGQTSPLNQNTEGFLRVVTPDLISPVFWNSAAAAGGIANSAAAVTIQAAAGAGVRNFLKSLQLSTDTLGAATEIAIRDGAAGTVLWRGKLQTAALPLTTINFDPPLKGTANTLMEIVTLTAVTGGVYANAQGYTGT